MPAISIGAKMRGPFFDRNVGRAITSGITKAIHDLVAEGERKVKLQLYPGHGFITGRYRNSVNGEVLSDLHGVVHDTDQGKPVVYGPWLEGVSSRNQRTRFKGYAMFRTATRELDQIAQAILDRAMDDAVRKFT